MKVKELIADLQKLDPELTVMQQIDSEGTGYYQSSGVEVGLLVNNEDANRYYVEMIYNSNWLTAEIIDESEEEWAAMKKDNPRVAVIYP